MSVHTCTNRGTKENGQSRSCFTSHRILPTSLCPVKVLCLRISIQSLDSQLAVHSACPSTSFKSIKVTLNPLLLSHDVSVTAERVHSRPCLEVWSYSAEISHWRKVNMLRVMQLDPNWECRKGHMGLITAQLSDSKAVFIDLAQARILQTLESPSMLMKPSLEIAPW